jgi:hypothetical protein
LLELSKPKNRSFLAAAYYPVYAIFVSGSWTLTLAVNIERIYLTQAGIENYPDVWGSTSGEFHCANQQALALKKTADAFTPTVGSSR